MGALAGGGMQSREQSARTLPQAVLASLAAHAALLLALGDFDAPKKRIVFPPPLVARLVAPVPVVPSPLPEPRFEPPPASAPRAVRPAPAAPSKPVSETAPTTESTRLEPDPTAIAPAAESPQSPPPAVPIAVLPAAPVAAAKIAAPPATTPGAQADLGTLEEYRKAIRIAAARYKRYPRVAIDNNWEGSVVVGLSIGASGAISVLRVKSGTSYEVLDGEALDMVRKAVPQVPIPAALRGKAFETEIRVVFSLRDETG